MLSMTTPRLTDEKRVKIADFGMARLMNENDYYRQCDSTPVPIKWMAPESVLEKLYSEKSDVVCIQSPQDSHRMLINLFDFVTVVFRRNGVGSVKFGNTTIH